jgi:hypothetical protein
VPPFASFRECPFRALLSRVPSLLAGTLICGGRALKRRAFSVMLTVDYCVRHDGPTLRLRLASLFLIQKVERDFRFSW